MEDPSTNRKSAGTGAVVDVFAVFFGALCLVVFVYWLSDRVPASLPPFLQKAVASIWTWLTAGAVSTALVGAVIKRRVPTAYVFCLLSAMAALALGMGWASNQLTMIDSPRSALQVSREYLKQAAVFAAATPDEVAHFPDPTAGGSAWSTVFRARSNVRWSLCQMARSKRFNYSYKPDEPNTGPGLQNCAIWLVARGYLEDDPSLYDDICRVSIATYSAEWGNFGALPTNLQLAWVLSHVDAIKRKIQALSGKPPNLPPDDARLKTLIPCENVTWPTGSSSPASAP
jgi:hypothetical protein